MLNKITKKYGTCTKKFIRQAHTPKFHKKGYTEKYQINAQYGKK